MTTFKIGDKVILKGTVVDDKPIPDLLDVKIGLSCGQEIVFNPHRLELDKPEKVKIPAFVAEWIEECKHQKFYALHGAYAKMNNILQDWRFKGKNSELFARAWLDGYEVEEPVYVVTIPKTKNHKGLPQRLCYSKRKGNYFFCGEWEKHAYQFTKKELEEAGFGWVFEQGFAKEVSD